MPKQSRSINSMPPLVLAQLKQLGENLAIARKAIDLGPPELKELLNSSGLGNHPEVVKLAYKVGKAISEDRFVTGSPKGPSNDPAKKLFPNMN